MYIGPSEIRIKPVGPELAQISEWCIIISLTCRADIDMLDGASAYNAIQKLIERTGLLFYPEFVSKTDTSVMVRIWEYKVTPAWLVLNTMEEIQEAYKLLQEAGNGISRRSKEERRYYGSSRGNCSEVC